MTGGERFIAAGLRDEREGWLGINVVFREHLGEKKGYFEGTSNRAFPARFRRADGRSETTAKGFPRVFQA